MGPTKGRDTSRRGVLGSTSALVIASLAGCLRLAGNEETNQPAEQEGDQQDGGVEGQPEGGTDGQRYTIDEFHPIADTFSFRDEEEGVIATPSELATRSTSGDRMGLEGRWDGDEQLFTSQHCARYSFDVLEDGSVVSSSNEQILMIRYLYRIAQTNKTLFVTCEPSINPEWDSRLVLSGVQDTADVPADINREQEVFEIDLSRADVPSGDYNWRLEVMPPNNHTFTIGEQSEELVSVGAERADRFLTRTEAIEEASEPSTTSATPVAPTDDTSDGLTIETKASYFGASGSARYITRDISVQCSAGCAFGSGNEFRIHNLTTGSSVSFSLRS